MPRKTDKEDEYDGIADYLRSDYLENCELE